MKIGLDFDDVVADSGIAIIEMHNQKHGTHFKKEDFKNFFFEKTWGVPREVRNKEIDEFFATDQLKKISPMAGAVKAIGDLKKAGHEIYIITGRANKNIEQTELWIEAHFPDIFAGVHFGSSSRTEEIPRKKSETCRELGIEIFIDDDLKNVFDCAEAGIKVFIFDQPWNRQGEFPANVERVKSWDEIVKKLSHTSLADEMRAIPIDSSIATDEVAEQFFTKLDEGGYSRDEDVINHFGAYFALYDPVAKTVFITHHKKSGLWLFPGGHVDKGETTMQTLKREMHEELGVVYDPHADLKPFLLTITRMDTPNYKCKTHYDVWYSIPMGGSDFKIDPSEFHDTKWLPVGEARKLMVDEQNLQALDRIEQVLSV